MSDFRLHSHSNVHAQKWSEWTSKKNFQVLAYGWFAAIILVELSVCYALGLDTLFVGYSRVFRLIQLGVISVTSLGFLVYLSQCVNLKAGVALDSELPASSFAWPGLIAIVSLVVTSLIALYSVQSFVLLTADESAYVFQSNMFLQGRLWLEPTPIQPYVSQHYIFLASNKLISQYPPGWAALLAAGQAVSIPAVLINPIISAFIILAIFRFTQIEYGSVVGILTATTLAISAFFLFNSASLLNGNLTLLFGILFAGATSSFMTHAKISAAIGMGVFFSCIAVTRHFDALLFAVPAAVVLLRYGSTRHWLRLPIAALAAAPAIILLLYYYYEITGSPFISPQTLRNPSDGLFGANWSVGRATEILAGRVVELAEWTSPPFVVAFVWALIQKFRQGRLRFFDLYGPIFLAGYWLYWADGGLRWGPRYIYPALPFMVLTVVEYAWFKLKADGDFRFAHLLAVSALMSTLQVPFLIGRAAELVDQTQDVRYQVMKAGIHQAVVVVTSSAGNIWSIDVGDLARNGTALDGDVVYAYGPSLSSSKNTPSDIQQTVKDIRKYFPTREIWLYQRDGSAIHGSLIKA